MFENNEHTTLLPPDNKNIPQSEANDKQKTAVNIIEAVGGSQDVLLRVNTVFPFTLFPDTVTIDRSKLTITHRDFFKSGEALSINIEDILNVTATVGPFVGSIKIATRFFGSDKPFVVKNLNRRDVLRVKRILQGYIIAKQKEVDCTALSTVELAKLLDELGKVSSPEKV